jgi:hypothetical protein
VTFALSGLSNTKNMKNETAIQLYNLEQDNGKSFTLQQLEQKFFSIDEKTACDQSLTQLALSSMVRHHNDQDHKRGDGSGYGSGRGYRGGFSRQQ